MMLKETLWIATVSFEFVVLAVSEADAMQVAEEHAADDFDNHTRGGTVTYVRPLPSLAGLPDEWDGDCIPWGSEDDRTCAEVLAGDGGHDWGAVCPTCHGQHHSCGDPRHRCGCGAPLSEHEGGRCPVPQT